MKLHFIRCCADNYKGKAVYTGGKWTMEYGRKLTTGSQYDVQFSDLTKEYLFGTAIFDSSQTRHSYESGVSKLVFAVATPAVTTTAVTTGAPVTTPKTAGFEILIAVGALLVALLARRR